MVGIPAGLDFTGGHFTPELGLRAHLQVPRYGFGLAFTNTFYFQDKPERGVKVEHNPFLNAEFSWSGAGLWSNNEQAVQLGYLLNSSKSTLFEGTTFRAVYRRKVKELGFLQAGLVATERFKTVYPVIGFRIW